MGYIMCIVRKFLTSVCIYIFIFVLERKIIWIIIGQILILVNNFVFPFHENTCPLLSERESWLPKYNGCCLVLVSKIVCVFFG